MAIYGTNLPKGTIGTDQFAAQSLRDLSADLVTAAARYIDECDREIDRASGGKAGVTSELGGDSAVVEDVMAKAVALVNAHLPEEEGGALLSFGVKTAPLP